MSEEILKQLLNGMNEIRSDMNEFKVSMDEFKADMDGMKADMKDMKADMRDMKAEMNDMKAETNSLRSEMNERFNHVDHALEKIINENHDDVVGMLKTVDIKLDTKDNEIQAVNRRLHRVEGVVEGLSKQ